MTAVMACGSCGINLRENAKFCDECGIPTAASADRAKYKQVTVLFADVVRSMDIAAAVDLERLRDIMTELVERAAAVVQRYGGTADYNGDGIMALFGAPVALEDHALRGCLAALAIQEEANRLADEVQQRDGVALALRVGLNSGRVIAGGIGSGSLGYAATGETVGFAERMESAAPPGGVMLSESTARLVEHAVKLAEPEWVRIKGCDEPVMARRLLAIGSPDRAVGRAEAELVGRRREMAAIDAMVDCTLRGRGGVVHVVGPAGIGKSRVAREVAARASSRGVEVCWTFCESHARDVPFDAATRLLRSGLGIADLDGEAARAQVRTVVRPDADPQDLLLLDDLLGIADPEVSLPQIEPGARRRRLIALINAVSLAREDPTMFVIEDAHWIDEVSDSMLADFLRVVPHTSSMVLITARPEYDGALTRPSNAQTITLGALKNSEIATLLDDLLGSDPSVAELALVIAERAAGNPFFTEEMVRELVQRGVLSGEHGDYVCRVDVADLSVPPTVQAAIEARIDRLDPAARQTLNAASVIGARFEAELLGVLGIDPVFDELLRLELIDQVRFSPSAEYSFRHPLIRAVAYETQLRTDRAEWHLGLAAAIQERDPQTVEENGALIAEHLHAAGEPHAAYDWHMRAGAWSSDRGVDAARLNWERARRIADELADDDPARMSMRIAPRAMLCVTDWLAHQGSRSRFGELRDLCDAAGDKVSLAIGMSGLATELLYSGRAGEGSRLASEQMSLLESIGDHNLTAGLAFVAFANWFNSGEFGEIERLSQTVIDQAGGDPAMGSGFGLGSPLAVALAFRGVGRWWMGRPGWRQDFRDAFALGRDSDPTTFALVAAWTYGLGLGYGVLRADDAAMGIAEEAVHAAQRTSNDFAVAGSLFNLATTLLYRDSLAERDRGLELMTEARDVSLPQRAPSLVPIAALWAARETATRGDRDAALPVMRRALDELHREGRLGWEFVGIAPLVETLLEDGTAIELAEAQGLVDRLAGLSLTHNSAMLEVTLLHLRALMARARGDAVSYKDLATRYHEMAESLGYEGHIAWAASMAADT